MIDNCGPQGDALLDTEKNERICSVSSITGALIAQTIGTETVKEVRRLLNLDMNKWIK